MIVFVVTNGTYSDFRIEAVFSTRELAEKHLVEQQKVYDDGAKIQEWVLDERKEEIAREYWVSSIDLLTGKIFVGSVGEYNYGNNGPAPRFQFAKETDRSWVNPYILELIDKAHEDCEYDRHVPTIYAHSFVSQEHANKLVVELRQKLLASVGGVDNLCQPPKTKLVYIKANK